MVEVGVGAEEAEEEGIEILSHILTIEILFLEEEVGVGEEIVIIDSLLLFYHPKEIKGICLLLFPIVPLNR